MEGASDATGGIIPKKMLRGTRSARARRHKSPAELVTHSKKVNVMSKLVLNRTPVWTRRIGAGEFCSELFNDEIDQIYLIVSVFWPIT
jgi:hypothetical protein